MDHLRQNIMYKVIPRSTKKLLLSLGIILVIASMLPLLLLMTSQDPRQSKKQKKDGELTNCKALSPNSVSCTKKVKHIAFLKVHKAASSTVQNIFLRFGWANDLTFVLPFEHNVFKYPNIISLRETLSDNNVLPRPQGRQFDILCNHVIFNRKAFQRYLPEDTVYIGILREPFEMFKSTLNYLRPGYIFRRIKANRQGSVYLRNPKLFEPKLPRNSFTNNRMAVEFGFSDDMILSNNTMAALEYIEELDKVFGLVMIAELFDESVLLLRRLLNWTIKDILYIDKNVAKQRNDGDIVDPRDLYLYRKWASMDFLLYNHFHERLHRQIQDAGDEFQVELRYFRRLQWRVTEYCFFSRNIKRRPNLEVQGSVWNEAFEVTMSDCERLDMSEIPFINMIRMKQYG